MTQLQTRETAQTPSEPTYPQDNGTKWTSLVVVGVIALLAAAFGVAIWANSDTETANQPEVGAVSNSVEIVQNEIDKALAATGAEPSSVEIVQNEIDAALTAQARQWTPYWVTEAEVDVAFAATAAPVAGFESDQEATSIHLNTGSVTGEYYGNSGELYPALPPAVAATDFDYNPDGGLDAVSFSAGN